MNNKLTRAVFFLVLTILTLSLTVSVNAAGDEEPTSTPTPEEVQEDSQESKGGIPVYGGSPVYGGGVISPREGEIIIDKFVKNPSTGTFVDHLGPTDPKYRPLDIVTFQVKVKNPGDETLDVFEVVDTLPDFVDYMPGEGNYDQDTRKLTIRVENLNEGETRNFEVKARVSHQSSFPEDKNIVCPVNKIEAVVGDKTDNDESQFCIEKEVVVPQVPEAGSESLLLAALGSALSIGLFLRKKFVNL